MARTRSTLGEMRLACYADALSVTAVDSVPLCAKNARPDKLGGRPIWRQVEGQSLTTTLTISNDQGCLPDNREPKIGPAVTGIRRGR